MTQVSELALMQPTRIESFADAERLARHGVRTIKGAAEFLGVSGTKVYELIREKSLWSFKHGGRRVIAVVELRRHLARVIFEESQKELPLFQEATT